MIESVLRIVDTVVARPGIKEIAEYVEMLGGTGASTKKSKKEPGYTRCLRRKVQI